MDQSNIRNLKNMLNNDPQGKISLLMDYTSRPADVADPWYTGDFQATWEDVSEGCNELLTFIMKKNK
jgi:protein-tyrosine phosphatase